MFKSSNTDEFIKKAKHIHGNLYDYSLVDYKDAHSDVLIKCKDHGIFKKRPNDHLNGSRCRECAFKNSSKLQRKSKEQFILESKKINGDKYNYSKTEYINNRTKVIITCLKHGDFLQIPNGHVDLKQGCPKCRMSKGESKIELFLISKNYSYVTQKKFDGCRNILPLPFDFYLPEQNICIEYDGEQHFKPIEHILGRYLSKSQSINQFKRTKFHDSIKDKYCIENNIKLIRISYKEKIEQRMEEELCRI